MANTVSDVVLFLCSLEGGGEEEEEISSSDGVISLVGY
jgi:hypothetical protein